MITALNWTLGPYRIAREIGRGQFGTVYEATDGGPPDRLEAGADRGHRWRRKGQSRASGCGFAAALQLHWSYPGAGGPRSSAHRSVLRHCDGTGEGEGAPAVIKAGRLSDRRAGTIALGISQFLALAHAFTSNIEDRSETLIVHGDLKPAHILLLADGSIRVLDFGIAKALAAQKPATTNQWASVDYASPERLESGRVNEQVDFWSMGIILFEMLSARYRSIATTSTAAAISRPQSGARNPSLCTPGRRSRPGRHRRKAPGTADGTTLPVGETDSPLSAGLSERRDSRGVRRSHTCPMRRRFGSRPRRLVFLCANRLARRSRCPRCAIRCNF